MLITTANNVDLFPIIYLNADQQYLFIYLFKINPALSTIFVVL